MAWSCGDCGAHVPPMGGGQQRQLQPMWVQSKSRSRCQRTTIVLQLGRGEAQVLKRVRAARAAEEAKIEAREAVTQLSMSANRSTGP